MDVTETRAEGLARELKVTVPAATLDARLNAYLDDMRQKVRLKGFRPGKVPMAHLKKMYGRSAMAEVINEVMTESIRGAVEQRDEKPALQPDVDVDETAMTDVMEGKSDLSFAVKYEVLPEIEVTGLDQITVEKPTYEVPADELDAELTKLAENYKDYDAVERAAQDADRLKIDFVGKIDGEPFEGGSAEGIDIVIGQGRFIPGFEEQLNGTTAGQATTVTVTFPEDYGATHLAGKEAVFDVTVQEVAAPKETTLDDAFAEKLGMENLEKLREAMKGQMQSSYDQASRAKVKRALLDALDERFAFTLPQKLVDTEFDAIWRQVEQEMAQKGETFDAALAEDADGSEAKTRADYQKIAERRVRLGLLLSEIGSKAEVQVTDEEVQQALQQRMQQFPGQERQVLDYYRQNPQAIASLRAPIFEDKVVDYILELATVNTVPVSKEELLKGEDDEHDHDHAHDHDHDHHHHDHDHDHHHHDH
ncbi:trigger factor [Acuticoccus sp. I52.16.1]|uniref:trigger factor n=1 Tax=Acuticoccus sp. I52.16.1 TaxID=2928472 RepID=UPI001FD566D9|nr:trigger factor [Acuticoccus sp. I52.16.1]UOM34487.1 trigger factor [Acuticoccus sp. I52.16.1]